MRLTGASMVETVPGALTFITALPVSERAMEPWSIAEAIIRDALRTPADALKEAVAREAFREAALQRLGISIFRI